MNNKGFTIVELAIVLVVIGIILAMAVKATGLMHAARVRNDVAKLNKFEAAVMTGYTITGMLPEEMLLVLAEREHGVTKTILTGKHTLTLFFSTTLILAISA